MPVPEEIRVRLSRWCADQVPDAERSQRQIGYTTSGEQVTLLDRRPPTFPELGAAWISTPVAQLRNDEPGRWSLWRPAATDDPDAWEPDGGGSAEDPLALLTRIEDAIRVSAPPAREPGAD
ncbi:hypothetical protein [Pseudonocardia acidicola]|uniref:Uncharacterized protein n=1 Tax=Pseudonocardia acidicola TaxID=2724939 RepID=A0ABX1SDU2_9PSEU|nr:hypothetical protein [Pseudonocardia acidicola]NMH98962.1 hypothetical protein [Pseudonocardia acidicola]